MEYVASGQQEDTSVSKLLLSQLPSWTHGGKRNRIETKREMIGSRSWSKLRRVELEPRSLDSYCLNSISTSSHCPDSCVFLHRCGVKGGWSFRPQIPSIVGFSQNRTGATLPSQWAQARSRAGLHAGRPGQLGQHPSGTIGTAQGPLTSYIIK